MTPEQFCYWLQGFGELNGNPPTAEQWQSINEHLAAVFRKVIPQLPRPIQPPLIAPAAPYIPPTIQPYIHDPNRVTCKANPPGPMVAGVLTC